MRLRDLFLKAGLSAVVVAALAITGAAAPAAPAAADGNESPGAPPAARSITAGTYHTCALLSGGAVKCFGRNTYGQLGQGNKRNLGNDPGEMAALRAIDLGPGRSATAISAGEEHTCAVLDDGRVRCWGLGLNGRLGTGSTSNVGDSPGEVAASSVDLGTGRTATAITAGDAHTCALLDDGTVKCWGDGSFGRLGTGATADVGDSPGEVAATPPIDFGAGRTVTAISAGEAHTCAILDTGDVKCWGWAAGGALGGVSWEIGDAPGEVAGVPAVVLGTGRTAIALSAGGRNTCVLLDDTGVKCWGENSDGQVGQGHREDVGLSETEMYSLPPVDLGAGRTATAIATGATHTCAVLDDATVKCWGDGQWSATGQVGDADLGSGPGQMGDALPRVDLGAGSAAVAVTTGGHTSCAVLDDTSVKCWGANFFGSLGQDDDEPIGDEAGEIAALAPIALGTTMQVQLTADQRDVRVGGAIDYHLEIVNYGAAPLTDVVVSDPAVPACEQPVPDLAVGQSFTVDCSYTAMAADQPAFVNVATVDSAQTGPTVSNEVRVRVGVLSRAPMIDAGDFHSCAVLDDGRLKCWGLSFALGQGDQVNRGDGPGDMEALAAVPLDGPVAQVAGGHYHTCALLEDGRVECWGHGYYGQLGRRWSDAFLGDAPGEMAMVRPVNLGPGRTATRIVSGSDHTCALLDNHALKCWGRGAGGRLGQGSRDDLGDDPGEMAALRPVDLGPGRTALSVSAGRKHTCAVLDDHTVRCWGANQVGQLGQDSTRRIGDQPGELAATPPVRLGPGRTALAVSAGERHTCALLDDHSVKCWGAGQFGMLGGGSSPYGVGDAPGEMARVRAVDLGAGHTAIAVTTGNAHTCAILEDRTLKCWGYGGSGALGQDSHRFFGDQPGEVAAMPPVDLGAGQRVASVSAGYHHTCARLRGGKVKCFGQGEQGQLGQDVPDSLGDDRGEMAALQPVFLGIHG